MRLPKRPVRYRLTTTKGHQASSSGLESNKYIRFRVAVVLSSVQ